MWYKMKFLRRWYRIFKIVLERLEVKIIIFLLIDADEFFNLLGNKSKAANNTSTIPADKLKNEDAEKELLVTESVSKNINWDAGIERTIKHNIIIGNYEGAVDCALKCGRMGEALLLAYSHSKELFESTSKAFFLSAKDPFLKNTFKSIIDKQDEDIARSHELKDWKEAAALAISLKNSPNSFQYIMNILASRFVQQNDTHHAILCYILAKNFPELLNLYLTSSKLISLENKKERRLFVIDSVTKLLFLFTGLGQTNRDSFPKLDTLLSEMALICLEHRQSLLAYRTLMHSSGTNRQINLLKDLLYHSTSEIAALFKPEKTPFKVENVKLQQTAQPKVTAQNQHQPSDNQNQKKQGPNQFAPAGILLSLKFDCKYFFNKLNRNAN
jgi:protein transport protein SEC31